MASQTMTPADRIRELSVINAEVAAMLQSAGHAINSLTTRPLKSTTDEDEDTQMTDDGNKPTLDQRKAAFSQHTEGYYTALQSIVARLRRQAYALEEAGIIASEGPALASNTQQRQPISGRAQGATGSEPAAERITNSGLGNLDVGWLNSRGNKVGMEKEAELMNEARKMLENRLSEGNAAG